jgi:NADPH-dependent curcumin reductase CurA
VDQIPNGGTVGEIVASRNPKYAVGDIVLGYGGWQEYALSTGAGLRKLDPAVAPASTLRCAGRHKEAFFRQSR